MTPEEILDFWFGPSCASLEEIEARVDWWFRPNPALDDEIRSRFTDLRDRALAGEFDAWRGAPQSTVALTIVLDQFPRNLHRGDARSFAYDATALGLARAWTAAGSDRKVAPILATFGYLPFEHSESRDDQEQSVALFQALVGRVDPTQRETFQGFLSFADRHREVVRQFGRFPHRNAVLDREPTAEEIRYLGAGGDTFGG